MGPFSFSAFWTVGERSNHETAPSLIWLEAVISWFPAANAPEVIASTTASAAIKVIPFFKVVPFVPQAPIATRREQRLAWDLRAALTGTTVALGRGRHNDAIESVLGATELGLSQLRICPFQNLVLERS